MAEKSEDLPLCDIDINGALFYVTSEKLFYYCDSDEYVSLDLNGKDGTDGQDGADGRDGVDGQNGADGIDGLDGLNGVDGLDGLNGVDGENGTNGQDGVHSLIHMQFIQNDTDCLDGGVEFITYLDHNKNNRLDNGDEILQRAHSCGTNQQVSR